MIDKHRVTKKTLWFRPTQLDIDLIFWGSKLLHANLERCEQTLEAVSRFNFARKTTHLKKKLCSKGHMKKQGVRLNVRGRVVCHNCKYRSMWSFVSEPDLTCFVNLQYEAHNVRLHPNVRLDADVEIHLNFQTMSQKESLATLDFPGSSHRNKLIFRR